MEPQAIGGLLQSELASLQQRISDLQNSDERREYQQSQETPNATSSNCPFDLCDGSGYLVKGDTAYYCKCYQQVLINKCFHDASVPAEFASLTVASFDVNLYQLPESKMRGAEAKRIAKNYVQNFRQLEKMGKGLYFYSAKKGSGKTRLAVSIGNALIKTYQLTVKFITTIDLFEEIKATYHKESGISASDLIHVVKNVEVLILDDIGTEKEDSHWIDETLFAILNYRMTEQKVTLFTSNCIIDELPRIDKITSRINRMALPIWMPEEEIRSELAKQENESLQTLLLQ
jgi:DNA replication protein DnaC